MRKWVGESRTVEPVTANDLLARTGGDLSDDGRTSGDEIDDGWVGVDDGGVGVDDGIDHVRIPAGMLADLHDPRLIITSDYVGPVRGVFDRHVRSSPPNRSDCRRGGRAGGTARRHRAGGTSPVSIRPLVVAVALTAITVAPLTLALSHWIVR